MKGQRKCQWLIIGCTELCGKICLGEYCKVYLARLRKRSRSHVFVVKMGLKKQLSLVSNIWV